MLLPIRPICNRKKIRKDGTSLIQIQYCFSAERKTLVNTGIAIPPNFWTKKSLCISDKLPSSFGQVNALNIELKRLVRIAEDILAYALNNGVPDPVSFLKKTFKPDFELSNLGKESNESVLPKLNLDVYFQIDEYIKSKTKHVTPKMLNVYRNMRDTLKAFEAYRKKPISFESFDLNFYEEFVEYMMYDHIQRRRKEVIKGFRISTVGKTIKQLRIFLRNRIRRKIIAPINLEDYKILDEETDAVYLTRSEISLLYQLDLSGHSQLIKYRDLFVLGCLTGLRFSDFSIIRKEDVRQGMLYKKQGKSNHWVVIPLRQEANDILVNRFKFNIPNVSNGEFNRYIKEIGKLAGFDTPIKFSHKKGNKDIVSIKPKYLWITSHTCRRSFCTNEFLSGTPAELIMKISGHKSLRDFYKYIRITPEEAGQKIREIWENRGDMSIIKEKEDKHSLLAAS
jgi:site-specific recombinase XerD